MTDDVRDGPFEEYWDNGCLKEKGTKKDGERDGQCVSYYSSGELRNKLTWKNGLRFGPYESYAKDGRLVGKGNNEDSPEQWKRCRCGKPIGIERLRMLPDTTVCVSCARTADSAYRGRHSSKNATARCPYCGKFGGCPC